MDNRGAFEYFSQGNIYLAIDDYNNAIAAYSKAISFDAEDPMFYFSRGFSYGSINLYNKAIHDYNKAIGLGKKDEAVYNNRGAIFAYLFRFSEAIADYNIALHYTGDTVAASMTYFNRGNIYYTQKRSVLALRDYEKAHQLNPQQLQIRNSLVWMYATSANPNVRDPKRSAELAGKMLNTGNPVYMDTIAASLASNQDFKTAIALTNAALSISKNEPTDDYVNRALKEHLALYQQNRAIHE